MVKNAKTDEHLRRVAKQLAGGLDLIRVAKSLDELRRDKQPIVAATQLVNRTATKGLRLHMGELARGGPVESRTWQEIELMRERVSRNSALFRTLYEESKHTLRAAVDENDLNHSEFNSPETILASRSWRPIWTGLAGEEGDAQLRRRYGGVPAHNDPNCAAQLGAWLKLVYWASRRGQMMKGGQWYNDIFDLNQAIIATFCTSFATADKVAESTYLVVREIIRLRAQRESAQGGQAL